MAQLIGFLVAMYLCIYLPWKANQKEESRKRQDMYNNLNKKSVDEMEKKDGEWYTPSCYSVDIMSESGFDTGAALHYTTNNGDYICLGVVDNSEELKEYYLKTASEEDIKETGWN